ncbi:hypothetical protein KMZ32_18410 [Phycicoccus sp. MAQZ13P-2]|uniref:hypothetical protein n=1 Tax=Phycicoccus mangrovi TaxID=2840470 RepID=UPI001C000EF1|nr:hypothetical protein [Phycicoccus mangrovi]MBT9257612.1 hypothetical protein [Phycicoccus mangrovi]MBT9276051.1 hypothetical protein [Phycicoccus mangrovi]
MDRRSLLTAGLVAFLVVDLVLVVLALRSVAGPASGAPAPSGGSVSRTTEPSQTSTRRPTPSPSTETSETARPAVAPAMRLIAGVDDTVVWALDVGGCGDPSAVHVSTDGGRRWSTEAAPGGLTRLRPADAERAFAVGGDDGCAFRLWDTADSAASWSEPRSATTAWGRDPQDPTLVHVPGGDTGAPCRRSAEVLDLAGLGNGVASVACSDGTLRSTDDGGASWRTAGTVDGLAALALTGPGVGALAALDDGCEGVRVLTLVDGEVGDGQCVGDERPRPGRVSLSLDGSGAWLVAGDSVLRAGSADLATADFAVTGEWPRG